MIENHNAVRVNGRRNLKTGFRLLGKYKLKKYSILAMALFLGLTGCRLEPEDDAQDEKGSVQAGAGERPAPDDSNQIRNELDPDDNGSLEKAKTLGLPASYSDSVSQNQDKYDYFRIEIAEPQSLRFEVMGLGSGESQLDFYLQKADGSIYASSRRNGNYQEVNLRNMPAGQYFIQIEAYWEASDYKLSVLPFEDNGGISSVITPSALNIGTPVASLEQISGMVVNSEVNYGSNGVDEVYFVFTEDSRMLVVDYQGDSFDQGENCYTISSVQLNPVESNVYAVGDPSARRIEHIRLATDPGLLYFIEKSGTRNLSVEPDLSLELFTPEC